MKHPLHATTAALGLGVSLLLAGCGGRFDDAPAATAEPHREAPLRSDASPASGTLAATAAPAASTPIGTPAEEFAQMRQQIAFLRREVADLRAQVSRLPGNPHTAEAEAAARRDPEARAEAEREERLRAAATEQAFRNEQRDPRWSPGTSASIRSALADLDESVRNQVRSVECRTQSCRVEIGADNSGTLMRDLPIMLGRLGAVLPNATATQVDQGDGRQATVLYLSR